jgi:hypothetical protein
VAGPEARKKMALELILINDSDLRNLAMERANILRDMLLRSGKVSSERIFIIEPEIPAPGKEDDSGRPMVEFTLK